MDLLSELLVMINASTDDYVAWCWKAGGPAVTNNDGSRTTQISADQTAGFSIGTFTGVMWLILIRLVMDLEKLPI